MKCVQVTTFLKNKDQFSLIDVRSSEEFSSFRIAGSVNVPLDQVENEKEKIYSSSKKVLFLCLHGVRAEYACSLFKKNENISYLEGGLAALDEKGFSFQR